jgi:hypothetical protein
MIGTDERTDSLSLLQMLGIDANTVGDIGASFNPPATAASGISLSLNKRLSRRRHASSSTGHPNAPISRTTSRSART